ncbi:MAG: tyrosine-type recombinase/integrase [Gammaproteobacteria bacterium]|nr:tyrosine-type recombinase/integrase [Gammaproteobacteria bacterium]
MELETPPLQERGDDPRIFPYLKQSISAAFMRGCIGSRIVDLHFHDLRHHALSILFEQGYSIQEVAIVSGHSSWDMLKRYTHIKPESLHRSVTHVGRCTRCITAIRNAQHPAVQAPSDGKRSHPVAAPLQRESDPAEISRARRLAAPKHRLPSPDFLTYLCQPHSSDAPALPCAPRAEPMPVRLHQD